MPLIPPQLFGGSGRTGGGTLTNEPIDPTIEFLFGGIFTSDDWLEAVNLYSPTQLSMGRKRSHATLTGYIPFGRIKAAFHYFLGFSWIDDNNFLRRQVPATHPLFPYTLYATEVTECVGVKFVSKAAAPHPWSLPYATYNLARVTIAYSQPPYEVLADDSLTMDPTDYDSYAGQELRRWCYWSPKNRVDQLTLPGGQVRFLEGPYQNKPIQGIRQVFRAEKSTRRLIWHNVPQEFVSDDYGFMPKIEGAIGKINSDLFFADSNAQPGDPGYPHTWLLSDVDTVNSEIYADPIASAAFEGLTRRMDIIFTFEHFNPENGHQGSTEAGWRLTLGADGKWYKFGVNGTANFPNETSFLKLFTYHTHT